MPSMQNLIESKKQCLEIILGCPVSTNLESMLNFIDNFQFLKCWIDVLKLKYFSKKFHNHRKMSSKRSRIHKVWEYEMVNNVRGELLMNKWA